MFLGTNQRFFPTTSQSSPSDTVAIYYCFWQSIINIINNQSMITVIPVTYHHYLQDQSQVTTFPDHQSQFNIVSIDHSHLSTTNFSLPSFLPTNHWSLMFLMTNHWSQSFTPINYRSALLFLAGHWLFAKCLSFFKVFIISGLLQLYTVASSSY